jgi:apolipoprotein N-acyltransferase
MVLINILGGILLGISFPNRFIDNVSPIFAIIGLLFFFITIENKSLKFKFLMFQVFSMTTLTLAIPWVPAALESYLKIMYPINWISMYVLSIIFFPHMIIYFLINFKFPSILKNTIMSAFIMSMLYYYVPNQFPLDISYLLLNYAPYVKGTQIFGMIGNTFFCYLLIFSLLKLIKEKKIELLPLSATIIYISLNIFFPIKYNHESNNDLKVRLVQPMIEPSIKDNAELNKKGLIPYVIKIYKKLSLENLPENTDAIVLPETVVPQIIHPRMIQNGKMVYPKFIQEISKESKANLIFGARTKSDTNHSYYFEPLYNSLMYLDTNLDLQGLYHKAKLLPFAETLPLGLIFRHELSTYFPDITFMAVGDSLPILKIKDFSFINIICYESVDSKYIADYLNSTHENIHFIMNITNDGYYARTSQLPQHHLVSTWRSIEFNIPMIRVDNVGISSVIYPDGSTSKQIPANTSGYLDVTAKINERDKTIYQIYGILPLIILFILLYLIHKFFFRNT